MKRVPVVVLSLALACGLASRAAAAKNDWAEGTSADSAGASRDYYNSAGRLAWKRFLGDWRDARDREQGDTPYARARVTDNDTPRPVEWDVTPLVREWLDGKHPHQGFFLRTAGDGGTVVFASREHKDRDRRPQLLLAGQGGQVTLGAEADTTLDKSTYRSLGHLETLRVSGHPNHTLVRFPLAGAKVGPLTRATLRLFTTEQFGPADVGVFRCRQGHDLPPSDPIPGLAARHPGDRGLRANASVVFAEDFESPQWADGWTHVAERKLIDVVAADPERKFEPLLGKALRARIPKGGNVALNTLYKFGKQTGREPEEGYFRYYLRLASDWNQTLQGGKLPGLSGTYGTAGWGGRKVDGTDGWSARGLFERTVPEGNPLAGTTPIGTYCYHADMQGDYGSGWVWQNDYRGFLERNRWYCVEHYLKLNTPGRKDGVLRGWVDGRLAFEKTDLRFRQVPKLRIEQVWMNVYHGGTLPSPRDQHVYLDNVVIASEYIGPTKP